jgi:Spy/CpxP family protein refolding chaperone
MMKIRSFAAALALAAAPGLLAAQQTQPAQAHGRHGGWQQGQRGEHRGGIQALIARRDQLHLTAAQVSRLQSIQQRLESQDRPLQDRMRALFQQSGLPDFRARRAERGARGQQGQRAQRPQLTEQQRQALRRLREQAKPIREQMRQNHQAALREVQAVLTPAQKQQVQQWRQQHQERRHGGRHGEGRQGQQGARGRQG